MPAWPSIEGSKEQGEQLPESGGAPAPLPCVKIHSTENQTPEDTRRRRITQGGRGRGTEVQRDPRQVNPPGSDRELSAGRGWKRGERSIARTVAYAGTWRGAEGQAAEADWWRVRANFRWAELCTGRGVGGWVKK